MAELGIGIINLVRGDTHYISRIFTDKDGNKLTFNTSTDQINFTVRKNINSEAVIEKKISDITKDSEGKYTITIEPEDTEDLDFGKYGYDIEIRIGNDFVRTVESGSFIISPYDFSRPGGTL